VAAIKLPSRSKRAASGASRAVVIVKPGETLSLIAARHGTTVAKLRLVNGLSSTRIRAGQKIRIPS
jgi:LysM repeat protein